MYLLAVNSAFFLSVPIKTHGQHVEDEEGEGLLQS